MKIEDILILESENTSNICLVRDRLFWQAWERSAFLFVTHFKKYQIHKKYIKKVGKDVLWLGFPKIVLHSLEKLSKEKLWTFTQKSEDCIIISSLPQTDGFEGWRNQTANEVGELLGKITATSVREKFEQTGKEIGNYLPAYKIAYDLCLHIHRATAKVSKEYKYDIGTRTRGYASELSENLHLSANNLGDAAMQKKCLLLSHRLRFNIRLLMSLEQLSIKQWGYLNQQIESLINTLRAESCSFNIGTAREKPTQSSDALAPLFNG